MLGENIKTLRKQAGMSQEELAIRLHVVRQTVSKWENNLSVPDAELLQQMAELFEVKADALLGAEIRTEPDRNELAEQLSRINEQLAVRNRRAKRIWTGWGSRPIFVPMSAPCTTTSSSGKPAGSRNRPYLTKI